MNLRTYVLLFAAFAACSTGSKRLAEVLPQQAADWQRQQLNPLTDMPAQVVRAGVEEAATVVYTGPGTVRVRVFRMKGETSAFELIQQWRQTDGMAVYKGPYFLVAEAGSDSVTARSLLQALQSAIK